MADSDPDYQALLRAAHRYRNGGLWTEAIGAYQRLLALRPNSPNMWFNLARLQRQVRDYEAALTSYQQAIDQRIASPEEAHLNRAVIFAEDLHRHPQAEQELDAALSLNPAYVPALFNLANLHEDLGRREAAGRTYERILALEPDNLEALARYAQTQPPAQVADSLLANLRARLHDPRGAAAGRASVGFALGQALDARGEYKAAFEAYAQAKRLSRIGAGARFVPYDRAAQERVIDQIIAAFPAPSAGRDTRTFGPPEPAFLCGMFRSGSTLLEQMLAQNPQVGAAGELDWLPRFAQQELAPFPLGAALATPERIVELAARYRRHLTAAFPTAQLVTDKRPDNFLYIGLIKRLFPLAKIVHTTREPLDNCLSVYFLHLDPQMRYAFDLLDIGHYYGQYRRLMAHWKRIFGRDILEAHYDSLVCDPRPVLEPLLDALGLDWLEQCLQTPQGTGAVRTASVWQVRQPLYRHASGRAEHYRDQLSALREYLEGIEA
ncbi:MAG: sulfotransferase family protein [Steroidobacteraceae bacterium]